MPKKILGMTLYTIQEAADILDVSVPMIREARREGRLKAQKIGRRWYFTHSALRAFANRKTNADKSE